MIPRKVSLLLVLFIFTVSGVVHANRWEADLRAGGDSVAGGLHYKRDFATGYMKMGVSGVYADDDDLEYKWGQVKLTVGRENIQPGLSCEVGLKGIAGDAEEGRFSGDVGAVAFTGFIGYLFPQEKMPIPLELFGDVSYAPEMLSFQDAENLLSYRLGLGVRIIENATILVEYAGFDVDMEEGPGKWNLDDGMVRLGLVMRF